SHNRYPARTRPFEDGASCIGSAASAPGLCQDLRRQRSMHTSKAYADQATARRTRAEDRNGIEWPAGPFLWNGSARASQGCIHSRLTARGLQAYSATRISIRHAAAEPLRVKGGSFQNQRPLRCRPPHQNLPRRMLLLGSIGSWDRVTAAALQDVAIPA